MPFAGINMSIDCAKTGAEHKPTPLMPIEITKHLLQNSWMDCLRPGSRPDWWALANAVVAVAIHYKTAEGSESQIAGIASAYFDNAMAVLPRMMQMQTPPLFGPALQAMEAYANVTSRAPVTRMLSATLHGQGIL
ncbi:hypothetical protein F503_07012 [Ophiostoma piceae UAMH 11346]|uniref:Uncharacterized protein n=1 Tax=Ophiostoma piceae (strain UAMH 11346) TaxID=1262450 RepID=S3CBC9_OPHP1|nr:hypothetical protein F503_07012 [Ophiostoma piceae UAMH 11346]